MTAYGEQATLTNSSSTAHAYPLIELNETAQILMETIQILIQNSQQELVHLSTVTTKWQTMHKQNTSSRFRVNNANFRTHQRLTKEEYKRGSEDETS
jgi:hypothetical protein